MLTFPGKRTRACDGLTRRDLLRVGSLPLFSGLALNRLLEAREQQANQPAGRVKSVVLINLFGGPSHIDMFDMKPDAPENVRGEFKPIATSVPGTSICEHLPRTAKWMHHSSLLRTITHNLNSHHPYSVLTGWGEGPERPGVKRDDHPSMGSVCQYLGLGPRDVPGYVFMPAYPGHSQNPRPGAHAGYLGPACDPLFTLCQPRFERKGDFYDPVLPSGPPLLPGTGTSATVTPERLHDRQALLRHLDQPVPGAQGSAISRMNQFKKRAFDLLATGKMRAAFDVSREPATVRQRYGDDLFGNSLLISRRLVEAGSTFITFHWECAVETHGCHWDHHQNAFDMLRFNLPLLDRAYDNLVRDLDERGLLESTLVVVTGEMGRSLKVNRHAGREHWTQCGFCLLTGGGIQPGSVYGKSDNIGAYPEIDPVSPGDLVATIYQLLGIDPAMSVPDLFGRPVHIAHGGRPLQAILA